MIWETQYKKYTLKLDGKNTFVYASRNLTLKEAKEDIKNRSNLVMQKQINVTLQIGLY